jgi:asparagine synthase (glutamine-hydrolysing)
MCGIGGYISCGDAATQGDVRVSHSEYMFDQLHHRGPYGGQILHFEPSLFMIFTHLPITCGNKLAAAATQPFTCVKNGIRYYLLCNGAIYNYKEIKRELELEELPNTEKQYEFVSDSDCEVILPGYFRWGMTHLLNRLRGMFAFSLIALDEASQQVINITLCRDTFGIKPLYYSLVGESTILFASEAKAFPKDFHHHIKEIGSGSLVQFESINDNSFKKTRESKYSIFPWDQPCEPLKSPVLNLIRDALITSVRRRLMIDQGDIAVLLSGGLDSSLVAAIAARELKSRGRRLHTFTISHKGSSVALDRDAARLVANHLGSIHNEVEFTTEEGIDCLPDAVKAVETYDPITVRASVPLFLLSRHITDAYGGRFRVVLVGEGADEVFAGYSLFSTYSTRMAPAFEAEVQRRLACIGDSELLRVDRITMANSIEARVPFLDIDLIKLCMRSELTASKLSHASSGVIEKLLLRQSFVGDWLPDAVLYRKKEQFADGIGHSWIADLQAYARQKYGKDCDDDMSEKHFYKSLFNRALGEGIEHTVKMRSQRRQDAKLLFGNQTPIANSPDQIPVDGSQSIREWKTLQTDPDLGKLMTLAECKRFCTEVLRVQLPDPLSCDLVLLDSLVSASLQTIPFTNLTMLLRPPRPPTNEEIKFDFLSGIGGPCAVVNAGFAAFIHCLGFTVCLTPATMLQSECHVGILVLIQGEFYYVDVGNGKPYFQAVKLGDERTLGCEYNFPWKVVWNEDTQLFHLFHGKAGPNEDSSGISWPEKANQTFHPARTVHYASFRPMIQRSRTDRTYGPFLHGLRLVMYLGNRSLVGIRDAQIMSGSSIYQSENEQELVEFAQQYFSKTLVDMLQDALDVLRAHGDYLWNASEN